MTQLALVTGSTRGLGLATATALAQSGTTVIVTGRRPEQVASVADSMRADGLDVEALVLDVSSGVSIRCAAEEVARRHERLDILVNNAGILPEATQGSGHFVDPTVLANTFQTNLFGPVSVIEAFLPLLRRSAQGRIVNVSSTMGSLTDQADPASPYYEAGVPAYRASKAALNSITIELGRQLADTTIKVTSVCPGFVQTELTPNNLDQAPLSADEAAKVVVRAATLPSDAPSGTFLEAAGTVPW